MMLAAGDTVDKYKVLQRLGGGGFAEVFKVRHLHLGTVHALKVLRPEFLPDEGVRRRFLDEGRVQARLVHPNIARVTDIVTGRVAGLVLEFLDGCSLADHVEAAPPMPEHEVCAILEPVLDALHFAHEHGVVHRDVKPENIFLAVSDDGHACPKLLDFGIARVRGDLRLKGKRPSTVATGMGTEGYSAPEQMRNASDVDRRADIFSVGVVLFELATGCRPFDRASEVDGLMALMNGDYEIPPQLRMESPRLASAIERALQTDRQRRFSNCREFAWSLGIGEMDVDSPSAARVQPPPAADTRRRAASASRDESAEDSGSSMSVSPVAGAALLADLLQRRQAIEDLEASTLALSDAGAVYPPNPDCPACGPTNQRIQTLVSGIYKCWVCGLRFGPNAEEPFAGGPTLVRMSRRESDRPAAEGEDPGCGTQMTWGCLAVAAVLGGMAALAAMLS